MVQNTNNIDKSIRTIALTIPNKEWKNVARELTHEAKNLYNITTYLIRQVVTSYDYNAASKQHKRKKDLHQAQTDVIDRFNATIENVNAKRKETADKKNKPFVEIASLTVGMDKSPLSIILNSTVLDNMAKNHIDNKRICTYRAIPAVAAQQVVLSVIDVWKATLSSLIKYHKTPNLFTGRPGYPHFQQKDGHFPLEFPYASISNFIPKPRSARVITEAGVFGSTPEYQQEFYNFNVKQAIDAACKKRGWKDYIPRHIRIIANSTKVKVEAIVVLNQEYPKASLLGKLLKDKNTAEEMNSHSNINEREEFLKSHLPEMGSLNLAGIDVGLNNVCAVSFSNGYRGMVHSSERLLDRMKLFDTKIDELISSLTTDRVKELQAKKKIGKEELIELRTAQKEIYSDAKYLRLLWRKNNVKSDFEHKITHDIVQTCRKNKTDVIVIGQNKGIKNNKSIGTELNRDFHNIAHARLMSLIKYKAQEYGIAVITTEESYTSLSSFVDNDELNTYDGKSSAKVEYSGIRSTENRHWFVRQNDAGKLCNSLRVHADINAAFNIIRKLFKTFQYSKDKISMKYNVRRISPCVGAVIPRSCQVA